MQYEVEIGGRIRHVHVHRADGHFVVAIDGREHRVDAERIDGHTLSLLVESRSHEVTVASDVATGQLAVAVGTVPVEVTVNGRRRWGKKDEGGGGLGPERVTAPMPGKIARVVVKAGDHVQPRQALVVIEAMKMENELRAQRAGVVSDIHVQDGQSVDAGALLLVVTPA